MAITAFTGPVISFGQNPVTAENNPDIGPSMFLSGTGILDPRTAYAYIPGQASGALVAGWLGQTQITTVYYAPETKAAAAVAAAANVVSGTAMTLVSSTAAGVTVGVSTLNALTGRTVTGLLAVGGGASGRISFGQSATIQLWDPTTMLSRALSVTGVSAGAGGAFLVSGYDVYGFPMSETITAAAGAATTNGKKAFKYIASVVPQFTDAHNYSIDTTDIFGLPLYSATFTIAANYDLGLIYNGAAITSGTGYVAGVTTTATTTTGDTRGTYAVQSASDGSKILIVKSSPIVANIGSVTGLFGVTQA